MEKIALIISVGFLWTFVLLGGVGFLVIVPLLNTSYENFESRSNQSQYSETRWNDLLFLSPLVICTLSAVCESCVEFVIALYVNDVFGEDATLTGFLLSALSLSSLLFSFIFGQIIFNLYFVLVVLS